MPSMQYICLPIVADDGDSGHLRGEDRLDPFEVFEVKVQNWQGTTVPRPSDEGVADDTVMMVPIQW